ncbi:hypothetical protein JW916_15675 [Candidatus Sumerlaeota bacterium]|nr:hypothetical protein [Candidatus Sumerlaeota bacterium]
MSSSWIEPLRTPIKVPHLVLSPSYRQGEFDSHAVDCPFVFRHEGRYYMTYVGWDRIGYRTGLASSIDLLHWTKEGMILDRGPEGSPTQFNAALMNILRDNDLYGAGELKKIDGRFVGTYHAYPKPGYEEGPAVIGLCWSDDLRRWELDDPILSASDGADWERGGLYKSWLVEYEGTYHLYYNAKTTAKHWNEQIGVATSKDLADWKRYEGNPIVRNGEKGAFDDRFAADPVVLCHEGVWYMFYYGLSTRRGGRDLVARSTDLLHWEKADEVLVDLGPEGAVDDLLAHKPGVIARDGRLYHFYCAVTRNPDPDRKIGEVEHSEIRGIALAHN